MGLNFDIRCAPADQALAARLAVALQLWEHGARSTTMAADAADADADAEVDATATDAPTALADADAALFVVVLWTAASVSSPALFAAATAAAAVGKLIEISIDRAAPPGGWLTADPLRPTADHKMPVTALQVAQTVERRGREAAERARRPAAGGGAGGGVFGSGLAGSGRSGVHSVDSAATAPHLGPRAMASRQGVDAAIAAERLRGAADAAREDPSGGGAGLGIVKLLKNGWRRFGPARRGSSGGTGVTPAAPHGPGPVAATARPRPLPAPAKPPPVSTASTAPLKVPPESSPAAPAAASPSPGPSTPLPDDSDRLATLPPRPSGSAASAAPLLPDDVDLFAGPAVAEPGPDAAAAHPAGSGPQRQPVDAEPVLLAAAAPRRCRAGDGFTASLVAYTEAARDSALRRLQQFGEDGDRTVSDISPERAPRWRIGAPVCVRLSGGPQVEVTPAEHRFDWSGRENVAAFAVTVRAAAPAGTLQLCFQVLLTEVPMAFVPMRLVVDAAAASIAAGAATDVATAAGAATAAAAATGTGTGTGTGSSLPSTAVAASAAAKTHSAARTATTGGNGTGGAVPVQRSETAAPRSAFASYASKDAPAVSQVLSALIRWAPGLDIFQDCLDLVPNEGFKPQLARQIRERDVFLLFWSRQAAASPWVRWEYETAREATRAAPAGPLSAAEDAVADDAHGGGAPRILPMPLEDPAIAPPPADLADAHLRDRFLLAGYALARIADEAAAATASSVAAATATATATVSAGSAATRIPS